MEKGLFNRDIFEMRYESNIQIFCDDENYLDNLIQKLSQNPLLVVEVGDEFDHEDEVNQ